MRRQLLAAARAAALCCAGVVAASAAHAQGCGSLANHYGPYDYRVDHLKRPIAETFHFAPKVEALVAGQTSVTPGPDIEYVLAAFPNHFRALVAVMKWARIKGTNQPSDLKYSVDCHFDRALRFRSDDVAVRMLFAQWLSQTNRKPEGLRQLALVDPKGNPQTLHNLGLVYADLGEFDQALERAHQAEAAGADITMLRLVLEKAGRWKPAAASGVAASGASVSAPANAPASAAASAPGV